MMNLVLIEDDDMLRKSLSFFLTSNKYDVVEFDNGLDAIEYIRINESTIDIVITDLNLPFAGGKEIVHTTRQLKNQSIKIIVLTSFGLESNELELFDLGADEFMSKPFSPAVLLKRIEKLTVNT